MHKVNIPNYIIERVIKRRGRLEIFDTINPKSTALLVIDMQNCFIIPKLSLVGVPGLEKIVPNINMISEAIRETGGEVIWTKLQYTNEWSSWHNHFCNKDSRESIISDTKDGAYPSEIWNGMDLKNNDFIVTKKSSSALAPDVKELRVILELKKIDTLIITGTLSNVCCESTARDAMFLNYKTIFVSDANGTRSDEEHKATLINMVQFFADVRTTEEVVNLLKNHEKS